MFLFYAHFSTLFLCYVWALLGLGAGKAVEDFGALTIAEATDRHFGRGVQIYRT